MPKRVHVPRGKRPPKGVLWASGVVTYHAHTAGPMSMFAGMRTPARLEQLRDDISDRKQRILLGLDYYKGRDLACPYRCPLDSKECPVDVLIEMINK